VLQRLASARFPLALASRLRSNLMGWGRSSMSWLSEIAHDQGKVTLFAAISGMIVGLTGAGVALIIGWRQGTSSRLATPNEKCLYRLASYGVFQLYEVVSSNGSTNFEGGG
jgi:hypothetical protein